MKSLNSDEILLSERWHPSASKGAIISLQYGYFLFQVSRSGLGHGSAESFFLLSDISLSCYCRLWLGLAQMKHGQVLSRQQIKGTEQMQAVISSFRRGKKNDRKKALHNACEFFLNEETSDLLGTSSCYM